MALLSGCAVMAPNYTPTVESFQLIKNSHASQVSVDKATAAKPELNRVILRASPLKSPYGDFSSYIEQALKKELSDVGLLDEKSNIVIGIMLTKNNIDPAIAHGTGDLAAVFSVTKTGTKVYEREITAHKEWLSSFIAAYAIPNAVNAYPQMVNDLITNLFHDPDFITAISN